MHVLSVVLGVAFVAQVGSHAMDNQVHGDHFAAILSLVLLLIGVLGVLGTSASLRNPFQNGIVTALILWAFVGAFALLLLSFSSLAGTLANDHDARVLGLFCALSQSLGICYLIAGLTSGIAMASVEFPNEFMPSAVPGGPLVTA